MHCSSIARTFLFVSACLGVANGCSKGSASERVPAPAASSTSDSKGAIYFPIASYRIGPYAAPGTGLAGGMIDYFQLVNLRDGGIAGVKIAWKECETEYVVERGVECYERLKTPFNGSPAAAFFPLSVGIMYALDEKARADKLPLSNLAGRIEAADGRVFPYSFPILLSGHSEMSAIIRFLAQRAGGPEGLKGKKLVCLYHGSPYGRDTIGLLDLLAKKYGFEITHIEVPHPGVDQQAQWLTIKKLNPDWVILRGWGVMNPVALKSAAKVDYPANKIIGNIWSDSEEDVRPAGPAAKGYVSITGFSSGRDYPVIQDIEKYVVTPGKSNMEDINRVGTVYYNVGVAFALINVEAAKKGQEHFGNHPLSGEEFRWGLEHVSFDADRLKELGATGLVSQFSLSCRDHDGFGSFKFQEWDGEKWKIVSDWVDPERDIVRKLIEDSSTKYGTEHSVQPRDCDTEARL